MISNVKKLMESKDVTVRELMSKTGLANKTVLNSRSNEKIEHCTLKTLNKVAQALDCQVKDLFTESDQGLDQL